MTKVLEFKPREVKQPSTKGVTSNESYYFYMGESKFSFGGAFSRDLTAKVNTNRESIELAIDTLFSAMEINTINEALEANLESVDVSELYNRHEKCMTALSILETPLDLDNLLDEGSEYAVAMTIVLGMSVAVSYTAFDFHRMIRDKWMFVECEVDELFSTIYFQISEKLKKTKKDEGSK